jgi:hypothetical protein
MLNTQRHREGGDNNDDDAVDGHNMTIGMMMMK